MVLEDVVGNVDDSSIYWNPEQIGDKIEGNLKEFETDNWDKKRMVLEMEDETEKVLPSHSDLLRYNDNVDIGDYLVITLVKIKESNNPDYAPKKIYKVQKDPEKAVEYEEVE